ncbi:MAG: helix-turn-helix domain-containing protein [Gemmataceae bacterium]
MAQGYYTLEEAAEILNMSVDELKMLARRGEVRSFQDRGTWRFLVADIQELARKRGLTSDPDLTLGESTPTSPSHPNNSPSDEGNAVRRPGEDSAGPAKASDPEVFPFSLEGDDTSDEMLAFQDGVANASDASESGPIPQDDSSVELGGRTEPRLGSDSDVRLVPSDQDYAGSDVRLGDTPAHSDASELTTTSDTGISGPASGPIDTSESAAPDSGVRLVSMDSDSDVRITGTDEYNSLDGDADASASESDVRLDQSGPAATGDQSEGLVTEELEVPELDNDLTTEPPAAPRPARSPFELETDLGLPSTGSSSDSGVDSDSSEFELSLPEAPIDDDDDAVDLGASPPPSTGSSGPKSGISLNNPLDSGISLEQESEGSDEFSLAPSESDFGQAPTSPADEGSSEFELTLDTDDAPMGDESSSEFELTLDIDDSIGGPGLEDESSSEFELTLDMDDSAADGPALGMDEVESSSEFELTIDADDEAPSSSNLDSPESEFELSLDESEISDIGDSEFELALDDSEFPSPDSHSEVDLDDGIDFDLDEESASEVVALDEDSEMGEFDLDEESGSEVVAIDEDEFDEGEETIRGGDEVELDEDFDADEEEGLFPDLEEDEAAAPTKSVVVERPVEAAPWGPLPTVFMLPCVAVLVLVGLLSFELLQSSVSGNYQEPGLLTKAVGGMFGMKF